MSEIRKKLSLLNSLRGEASTEQPDTEESETRLWSQGLQNAWRKISA